MTELVATAKGMLMVSRRKTAPIAGLGPKQLQYLLDKGWIDRRRVTRLHEKAAYEMRGDENREHMERKS
jgi:hypothetical protein